MEGTLPPGWGEVNAIESGARETICRLSDKGCLSSSPLRSQTEKSKHKNEYGAVMALSPKEIEDFQNMDDKCTFMFVTLNNHISSLKEMKWWIRGIGVAAAGILVKSLIGG